MGNRNHLITLSYSAIFVRSVIASLVASNFRPLTHIAASSCITLFAVLCLCLCLCLQRNVSLHLCPLAACWLHLSNVAISINDKKHKVPLPAQCSADCLLYNIIDCNRPSRCEGLITLGKVSFVATLPYSWLTRLVATLVMTAGFLGLDLKNAQRLSLA